ncbi:bifunctional 3-deoxy-7-phosphoheptulonate synthase/chorismate mutase [Schnuerera sp. xch1]|uniref:bifunctional 3-deoxy-7-phosphoheptulonate synthase/chorismate mutase n=1 Tax=Schnuerera sp. xch1 TaxID=2874283 RepID=UPI001CC1B2D1|nr:bifunctional 3-deoxy-7-phosphoheptulonate synthase/chorismate mutase [Schnuerera sp. xch1]MBZ2173942.1 bifunctional 3-deoxy-7-phosphoheptulonate synthase/chorismate mutase [Schnuerera sp. xch1]
MTKEIKIDDNLIIGGEKFSIIAGPCAVESEEQMQYIAQFLNQLGIKIIRGGAFKPRTNPNSFQGLGFDGLKILKDIKDSYGFKVISEIMDPRDIEDAYRYVDIYQIGSRNMQNYSLLREIGKTDKPVLLKRGMSATINEWIKASEYISIEGNDKIILCERGIRTFENYTRNTLDLMSVPIMKSETKYPVLIDPSHGTGRRELVLPASKAALAIGADGLIIEIHPEPDKALSDGHQSLNFNEFKILVNKIKSMKKSLNIY